MTSAVRAGASLLSIDRKLNTPLGSPAYNMSKLSFLIIYIMIGKVTSVKISPRNDKDRGLTSEAL